MQEQVDNNGNPPIYESDMLAFTTDVRMEKLGQMESSGHAIEAVFWLKDLMTQWRVKGKAFAIGDPRGEQDEEERMSRQEINKGLRLKQATDGNVGDWTWNKAVTKYFANHSPIMRGTCYYSLGSALCFLRAAALYFCLLHTPMHCSTTKLCRCSLYTGSFRNPPPGQPRSTKPSDPSLSLGKKVTDLHDPVARRNFRVVAIQAEEVERLDLSNQEDLRRWKWTLVHASNKDGVPGSQWVETELWP